MTMMIIALEIRPIRMARDAASGSRRGDDR